MVAAAAAAGAASVILKSNTELRSKILEVLCGTLSSHLERKNECFEQFSECSKMASRKDRFPTAQCSTVADSRLCCVALRALSVYKRERERERALCPRESELFLFVRERDRILSLSEKERLSGRELALSGWRTEKEKSLRARSVFKGERDKERIPLTPIYRDSLY